MNIFLTNNYLPFLFCTVAVGCAGTIAQTQTADKPKPQEAQAENQESQSTSQNTTDTPSVDADDDNYVPLTQWDLRKICGAQPTVSGGPTDERLSKKIDKVENSINEKIKIAEAAKEYPACAEAANRIEQYVTNHVATAHTICGSQVYGESKKIFDDKQKKILADNELFKTAISKVKDETQPDECINLVTQQKEKLKDWFGDIKQCRQEIGVAHCSEKSTKPEYRDAAKEVCSSFRTREIIPWKYHKVIAECLTVRIDAPSWTPDSTSVDAPGTRSLSGERALGGAALQSAIIRGAGEFFVERAEQEMSLFASEVVGSRLCEDKVMVGDNDTDDENRKTIRTLFKNTCNLLDPDADEDPVIGATPAAIREAARADLEAIPETLINLIKGKDSALACAAAIGWHFAKEAMYGTELIVLLSDLEPVLSQKLVEESCKDQQAFKKAVSAVAAIIEKIRKADQLDAPRLVRSSDLDYLVNRAAPRLTDGNKLNKLGKAAKEILRRARELDAAIEALNKEPSAAKRAAVVVAGLRTIEPVLEYAAEEINRKDLIEDIDIVTDIITDFGNREYAAAIAGFTRLKRLDQYLSPRVRAVLGLGATLAQAESAESVRTAFNDAALPLQSWRRKNESRFGITISGMVGLHGAWEWNVEDPEDANIEVNDGTSLSPALLVGIDTHYGLGSDWRWGLFTTVFDLGAIATIRLDSKDNEQDDTESKPEVRFEQIFAPGIYTYLGYHPFNLGFGVSFVPSLRPTSDETAESEPLNVFRLGPFLAVDVSVLPLL